VAILAILSLALLLAFSSLDLDTISRLEWALIVMALGSVWMVWHFTTRLPKNKKNHVGFVVAITSETAHERDEVLSDLIRSLRGSLETLHDYTPFMFIVLP
jgi:hypothetical protein